LPSIDQIFFGTNLVVFLRFLWTIYLFQDLLHYSIGLKKRVNLVLCYLGIGFGTICPIFLFTVPPTVPYIIGSISVILYGVILLLLQDIFTSYLKKFKVSLPLRQQN